MALPMVHLAVARNVYNSCPNLIPKDTLAEYYLGSIAPDGVHKRDTYTRYDKDVSHVKKLFDGSIDFNIVKIEPERWKSNILSVYANSADIHQKAFNLGCTVHLLTDFYNVVDLFPLRDKNYSMDKNPTKDISMAYYNDTDIADLHIYQNAPWVSEVWDLLKSAKTYDMYFDRDIVLKADEADFWRNRTLSFIDNLDFSNYDPQKYITDDMIEDFISTTSKKILEDLKETAI